MFKYMVEYFSKLQIKNYIPFLAFHPSRAWLQASVWHIFLLFQITFVKTTMPLDYFQDFINFHAGRVYPT